MYHVFFAKFTKLIQLKSVLQFFLIFIRMVSDSFTFGTFKSD